LGLGLSILSLDVGDDGGWLEIEVSGMFDASYLED